MDNVSIRVACILSVGCQPTDSNFRKLKSVEPDKFKEFERRVQIALIASNSVPIMKRGIIKDGYGISKDPESWRIKLADFIEFAESIGWISEKLESTHAKTPNKEAVNKPKIVERGRAENLEIALGAVILLLARYVISERSKPGSIVHKDNKKLNQSEISRQIESQINSSFPEGAKLRIGVESIRNHVAKGLKHFANDKAIEALERPIIIAKSSENSIENDLMK